MHSRQIAIAAAALAAAVPAQAQMVRGQDPRTVAEAMQAAGYQARLETDNLGDPKIVSGSSGSRFDVFFYNCTANKDCATIQFRTGYKVQGPVTLETLNAWNRDNRFGTAYLDSEGDPILKLDVDLDDGGMSRALFSDNLEFWVSVLHEFEKHIGYR